MMQKLYLHIGFHKTGSSSIQHFLGLTRLKLSDAGFVFPVGRHIANNHVELHTACLRSDRPSFFKNMSGINPTIEYCGLVEAWTRDSALAAAGKSLLMSAEGLSYLRYSDELDRLGRLFPHMETEIIVYQRNIVDWAASYKAEVLSHRPIDPTNKSSIDYLGNDSWLFDFESRLDSFRRKFGPLAIHLVDYDLAVTSEGSVIPSFLRTIGAAETFDSGEWKTIWKNPRSAKIPYGTIKSAHD